MGDDTVETNKQPQFFGRSTMNPDTKTRRKFLSRNLPRTGYSGAELRDEGNRQNTTQRRVGEVRLELNGRVSARLQAISRGKDAHSQSVPAALFGRY